MSDLAFGNLAQREFESASDQAIALAKRIGQCAHGGASGAEVVRLIKAWQVARSDARDAHERFLSVNRGSLRA
jgi:hypothetical protein